MNSSALKKPTGVYLLAVLFLLAPLGNIIISFAGSGVSNWYEPMRFLPLLQSIPVVEWLWLGLLFITGLLLFRPHKLSWSLAIFTLILVLVINALRLYTADANSINLVFLKVFSLFAILCTLAVLVIAFYFRFPYLDRRANWLTNTQRFDIRTQALCSGMKAFTESLSDTGCRISFDQPSEFKVEQKVKITFPDISTIEATALVIEKLEFGVRAEFIQLDPQFKQDLSRWLKTRKS